MRRLGISEALAGPSVLWRGAPPTIQPFALGRHLTFTVCTLLFTRRAVTQPVHQPFFAEVATDAPYKRRDTESLHGSM